MSFFLLSWHDCGEESNMPAGSSIPQFSVKSRTVEPVWLISQSRQLPTLSARPWSYVKFPLSSARPPPLAPQFDVYIRIASLHAFLGGVDPLNEYCFGINIHSLSLNV